MSAFCCRLSLHNLKNFICTVEFNFSQDCGLDSLRQWDRMVFDWPIVESERWTLPSRNFIWKTPENLQCASESHLLGSGFSLEDCEACGGSSFQTSQTRAMCRCQKIIFETLTQTFWRILLVRFVWCSGAYAQSYCEQSRSIDWTFRETNFAWILWNRNEIWKSQQYLPKIKYRVFRLNRKNRLQLAGSFINIVEHACSTFSSFSTYNQPLLLYCP